MTYRLEHDWSGLILIKQGDEIIATLSKHVAGTPGSGIPVDTHVKLQTKRAETMMKALNFAAAAGEITEMRLCEAERVFLQPDRLYRFTVDESCPSCVEAKRKATS